MKKQHIILAILISWLLGLSCCHWLSESKNKNTTTVVTDVKVWRKQLQEAERNYRQQTTALWQKQENLLKTGEKFSALLKEYKNTPEVTRSRLYLETMKKVLAGKPKTIIGAEQDFLKFLNLQPAQTHSIPPLDLPGGIGTQSAESTREEQ